MDDSKRDFFVSFNKADRPWATWIAWVLEENGHSVFFQDWDFRGNFVEHMDRSHAQARRTLAVLSDSYFGSGFTLAEWSARFAQDPAGREDRLVPVKVGPLTGETILSPLIYADLTDCDEAEAQGRLLDRVRKAVDLAFRPKPENRPTFPGGATPPRLVPDKPNFPITVHNLFLANPDFVGRESVLDDLRRVLTSGAGPAVLTQTITGLGGVGKTQTALAYAHRHLADYRLVWWLRAETAATLAADYATLAEPLGLDPMVADQGRLIAAVRTELQARDGWLLVLDNVEEPTLPRTYLPSTGHGHVLMTSRRTDWRGVTRTLPLEVMSEGEALRLLTGLENLEASPPAELAEAKALARELGYLPLALAQARAYMRETGESFAGYRELLKTSGAELLFEGCAHPDYPEPVARTWDLSIRAAERRCSAARPLLELLAFFAPDALPREVLDAGTPPEGLHDRLARNRAIAALARFSLIRTGADGITVHRLVQAVTRNWLDEAAAKDRAETAVRLVNVALPRPAWGNINEPIIRTLLSHALATAEHAEQLQVGLDVVATVLTEVALHYNAHAAWADAEPLFQRAIAIDRKTLNPNHPHLANSVGGLGSLYWSVGRYTEAEPLLRLAATIYENNSPFEDRNFAAVNSELGLLYRDIGNYTKAEPFLKRAIIIGEKTLGPEDPDLADGLNNLALLYNDVRRYAEAEALYKRVVTIGEKAFGPEHPRLAVWLSNLADLYCRTRRFAEAEPLLERAVAIGKKPSGRDHPEYAAPLYNLASLYKETGRPNKAEPLYQHAISVLEKGLPPSHPYLRIAREGYATFLDQLGRTDEAANVRARNKEAPG